MTQNTLQGLLFDKDGTLFDFSATWEAWAAQVVQKLAGGDAALADRLAQAAGYDLETQTFALDSAVIAGTNREAAECFASQLPDMSVEEVELFLMRESKVAPLVQAVPLAAYLDGLKARGLKLGVMTNDAESVAKVHLTQAGVLERFDFVIGFDSGYGAKPDPDPLLAFADHVQIAPAQIAMVGDSLHDLVAGRAAGMQTIGVLTGMASADQLQPQADVVLDDIGGIPDWLDR